MNDYCHVLNVYKPLHVTSHDVVQAVRRVFQLKKVGHLGTLDPLAEGVLPVALGQATRLIEYFPEDKQYRVEITLGKETTTLDREGELTRSEPVIDMTQERVEAALKDFIGTVEQEIPLFSAKKVNGKKLYELARQNLPIDAPVKTVEIFSIQLLSYDNTTDPYHPVVTLFVHCGTGTFMRALARDLGRVLGCGAYMSALVRSRHGCFDETEAVLLEVLKQSNAPRDFLTLPLPYLGLPQLTVSEAEVQKLHHGLKLSIDNRIPQGVSKLHDKELVALIRNDSVVAVVKSQPQVGVFKPVKVFGVPTLQV